ncbi:MAG: wax ester/triacylglycerol synthase family O-acyltransferase [Myxococcota bacterium]|nr:wax ester/triacylglycerol synthase family O-acyltransferase [Myxococcota bacterium]
MKALSGLDAAFLALETSDAPMNVIGTLVVEPGREGPLCHAQVLALVRSRLHRLAPLRRRLVGAPLGLALPQWIEDPDFTLESHVHRTRAREPGSRRCLEEVLGRIATRRLDRARPLWELWVVEGLEQGRVALVLKLHHALSDGVSGAGLLLQLLDGESEAQAAEPDAHEARPEARLAADARAAAGLPAWEGEVEPGVAQHIGRALARAASGPERWARATRASQRLADALLRATSAGPAGPALPFRAPDTGLSGAISGERVVATGEVGLGAIRFVRSAFGATVNDVVLATCTQALRRHLRDHGEEPEAPLLASVPVSVREAHELADGGNRLSAMFVHLPVHLDDPVSQLLTVRAQARHAKRLHARVGADTLGALADLLPLPVLAGAAKAYAALGLADRHRPAHNVVISNVPGPPEPLYAAGSRVAACFPMGPVFHGAALNLTVLSYADVVHFGATACARAVPDAGALPGAFAAGVRALVRAAVLEGNRSQPAPAAAGA